jgi:hypothetical protein
MSINNALAHGPHAESTPISIFISISVASPSAQDPHHPPSNPATRHPTRPSPAIQTNCYRPTVPPDAPRPSGSARSPHRPAFNRETTPPTNRGRAHAPSPHPTDTPRAQTEHARQTTPRPALRATTTTRRRRPRLRLPRRQEPHGAPVAAAVRRRDAYVAPPPTLSIEREGTHS